MTAEDSFLIEVLLAVIGTLAMLVLTGVLWYVRLVHHDVRELTKATEASALALRGELNDIAEKASVHEVTLYGAKGANGITRDVQVLKERFYERSERPRP